MNKKNLEKKYMTPTLSQVRVELELVIATSVMRDATLGGADHPFDVTVDENYGSEKNLDVDWII